MWNTNQYTITFDTAGGSEIAPITQDYGAAVELDEGGSFVLPVAEGEQKIIVTDKAGNTAEMTVTVNDGHTFGEWKPNGDGTYTRKCTVDGCNGLETKDCSGGKADCTEKAVCEVCGKTYGELDPKSHTDLKQSPPRQRQRLPRAISSIGTAKAVISIIVTKTVTRESPRWLP